MSSTSTNARTGRSRSSERQDWVRAQLRWRVTDLLRVAGALSVFAAWWYAGLPGGAVMFLVLGGQMVIRLSSRGRPLLDAGLQVVLLMSGAWAVLGTYATTAWLDLPTHALVTAVATWLAWSAMEQTGVAPAATGGRRGWIADVLIVTCVGITLAVLWELGEWFGFTFVSEGIGVGYDDTIGDLAWGALGAVAVGLSVAPQRQPHRQPG